MTTRLDPPSLRGQHVRLEPLLPEHAGALLEAATGSRASYAFTLVPADLPAMQAYVAKAMGEQDRGESLPFAVRDAANVVVGTTRYMNLEWWTWTTPPPEPVPTGPDGLEIGATWYASRAQRTAVNTEAKLLLCTQAFEVYGVRRIAWKTDDRNVRSREAILRLGARFDGVIRAQRAGVDGVVRDSAYYSMLLGEWPVAKAKLLARLGRT